MTFFQGAGELLFITAALAWLLSPVPFALYWWSSLHYIEMLERVQEYDGQKADYYFNGANERGLLDICEDAEGNVKILWKEDCK